MMTHYQTLFHINLRHSFYADKSARDLVLEPTSTTRNLMRQYNLLIRSEGGVFRLIYGTEAGNAPTLANLHGMLQLRFVLRNSNPYFQQITNLPFFNTQEKRLYFHNLGKSAPAGEDAALSINTIVGNDDLLAATDPLVDFTFQAADLGVVDLYIDHKGNASILPPSSDPTVLREPTRYSLTFEPRSTRWRYYIINRSQLNYNKMDVMDGSTALAFSEGAARSLPGGDGQATPLISEALFQLQETQPLKPKLKLSASNGRGLATDLFTIDLPTPDWRHIFVEDQADARQVYSDMYVYL